MGNDENHRYPARRLSRFPDSPKHFDTAFTGTLNDMVHTYFVYGTKYHKFNNVKVEGVKPLPYGDFRHDFLQCHVTKTKTTETDKRVVDGDDVANNLPLIIGLVLTVC